jgi:hypothetical protein
MRSRSVSGADNRAVSVNLFGQGLDAVRRRASLRQQLPAGDILNLVLCRDRVPQGNAMLPQRARGPLPDASGETKESGGLPMKSSRTESVPNGLRHFANV